MRTSKKALLVMLVAMAFVAIFALSVLGGCQDNKNTVGGYYLSEYKNGAWTSYKSDSDVPTANKFVVDTQDSNVYHLTIELEEGALVKIAQVGSSATYGGAELFSSLTALSVGENNAIAVGKAGTYELTFDTTDNSISYKFTEKPSEQPPVDDDDDAEVLLVEIDGVTGNVTITYPETKQLTATVTFDDATTSHDNVQWISSNTDVATISNGLITPVKAGATQITAKCGDVESDPLTVYVNGVATLAQPSVKLNVGEETTLTVNTQGGATVYALRSSDSDEAVIELSQDGKIKAVGAGTATVTVDWYVRPGVLGTPLQYQVTVNTPVEDIALASALTVSIDGTQELVVTFVPANASNQNYTYSIDQDDDVISVVKNGNTLTVSGLKAGTATITVVSEEGEFTKSCAVTVVAADSEFVNDIDPQTLTINKNQAGTLTVSGSGITSVAWSSNAASIATVTANETDNKIASVTGAGFGTATITATVTFASGATDTKTVDVLVAPDQMWVYGDIIENANGWDLTDTYEEAAEQGMTLTKSANGVFTGEFHLPSGKDFRIAHDSFDWKGIRYEHLSSVASEKENVVQGGNDQNSGYNVRVSKTGTYAITVDFTQGKPILKISCVSIDVTGVNVAADQSTLTSSGDVNVAEITLTVTPADATYGEDDIVWTLTNENLVDKVLSNENKTITITAKDDLTEGGIVRVTVTLKGKTAYVEITVVAAGAKTNPVTSIEFDEPTYEFNVNNNGAFNGNGTVSAHVNEDATNQGVTYSTTDSGITIDPATGVITATKVGTFTITAAAAGDASKTTTCTVTFYSDMFYLTGDANGWGDTAASASTVGSKFENFTFVDDGSHKVFTLQVAISSANSKFQIMFVGAGSTWDYAIKGGVASVSGGVTASGDNLVISSAGLYTITLDISSATPAVSAVRNGDVPTYTASLVKDGETVATSGNSTVVSNRYSMSLTETLEAGEYTIQINGSTSITAKITSLVGAVIEGDSNTTLFELTEDGKLKCVTAGKYRMDILSDTAGNITITFTAITAEGPVVTTGVNIQVSGDTNGWTPTDIEGVVAYYDASTGTYTAYFALSVTAYKGFGFFVYLNDSKLKEIWRADVTVSNEDGKIQVNDGAGWLTASISGKWANIQSDTTGTLYCKMTFTATGVVSIDTATTAFEQPA